MFTAVKSYHKPLLAEPLLAAIPQREYDHTNNLYFLADKVTSIICMKTTD